MDDPLLERAERDGEDWRELALRETDRFRGDMEALRHATNRGLDDEIVRYIANKRQWVRLYGIKVALCNNPKFPLPIAMRFLPHLNVRDLKALSRSKGIPSALCQAAKQMLQQRNA